MKMRKSGRGRYTSTASNNNNHSSINGDMSGEVATVLNVKTAEEVADYYYRFIASAHGLENRCDNYNTLSGRMLEALKEREQQNLVCKEPDIEEKIVMVEPTVGPNTISTKTLMDVGELEPPLDSIDGKHNGNVDNGRESYNHTNESDKRTVIQPTWAKINADIDAEVGKRSPSQSSMASSCHDGNKSPPIGDDISQPLCAIAQLSTDCDIDNHSPSADSISISSSSNPMSATISTTATNTLTTCTSTGAATNNSGAKSSLIESIEFLQMLVSG